MSTLESRTGAGQNAYCQSLEANEALNDACQQAVEAQKKHMRPDTNQEVATEMAGIFGDVRRAARLDTPAPQLGDEMLKSKAEMKYERVLAELESADERAKASSLTAFTPYDPSVFLQSYYDARRLAGEVCPFFDRMGDDKLLEVDEYRKIKDTCKFLFGFENQVQDSVKQINWVPPYEPQDVISVSGGYVVNPHLRRVVDYAGHQTFYQMVDLQAEYGFQIKNPLVLRGSGPQLGVDASFVLGSMENNSSRQFELALQAGWFQKIFQGTFVLPELSVGHAWNQLNFGEGLIPQKDTSIMLGGAFFVGYQVPTRVIPTFEIKVGYMFERSVTGPEYLIYGPKIELSPKWRWPY